MRSAAARPHLHRLHRVALVVGLAIGALTLTACADNPQPGATKSATHQATTKPTPSATPSASPSPSATPSGTLEQQLQAAAQTFYDTLNTSYKTLDTAPFKAISPINCEACDRYLQAIQTTKSEGHKYADVGEYVIADFKIVKGFAKDKNRASAVYQKTYTGFKEVDKSGEVVRNIPRQTWRRQAVFQRDGNKWLMVDELTLD